MKLALHHLPLCGVGSWEELGTDRNHSLVLWERHRERWEGLVGIAAMILFAILLNTNLFLRGLVLSSTIKFILGVGDAYAAFSRMFIWLRCFPSGHKSCSPESSLLWNSGQRGGVVALTRLNM